MAESPPLNDEPVRSIKYFDAASLKGQWLGSWTLAEKRAFIGFLIVLFCWGWLDVRKRAATSPTDIGVHKTDLTVFTGAGAAFFSDNDPYEHKSPRLWKYCYLPLLGIAMSPLDHLDTQTQAVVWFLISLVFGLGCWYEARRLYRRYYPVDSQRLVSWINGRWISWTVIAAVALPAINCLQRGQVGILLAYLMLLGIRLLVEARGFWGVFSGALIFALASVIKLLPMLPLVILSLAWITICYRRGQDSKTPIQQALIRGSWAPLGALAGLLLFIFVLPGLAVGHAKNIRNLKTFHGKVTSMAIEISPDSQMETPYTPRNQSLNNAFYRFGNWIDHTFGDGQDDRIVDLKPVDPDRTLAMDAAWVRPTLIVAKLFCLGLISLLAIKTSWQKDELGMATSVGLACVTCLIVSPMSRGHYFTFLLPAVLLVPCWIQGLKTPNARIPLAIAAMPSLLVVTHYVFLHAGAGRIGLLGLGTTAWFAVTCVWMLTCSPSNAEAHVNETSAASKKFATPTNQIRNAA